MSDPLLSDESLMQAAGRGDMAAFEQLVLRHQAAAWRVAVRCVGDTQEAEGLVQTAFLRILDATERYNPTASFRTYLYRVVTRLCIDHLRKKRPLAVEFLPETCAPGPAAPARLERAEMEHAIQTAIGALPPKQRLAIVLRYFEGLSGAEIAEALNTTRKGAERQLARARKRLEPLLRPLLEDRGE